MVTLEQALEDQRECAQYYLGASRMKTPEGLPADLCMAAGEAADAG